MFINDLWRDFDTCVKAQGVKKVDVCEKSGITNTHLKKAVQIVIPKTFIAIWESLGYDIKITYVKRNKSAEEVLK